MAIVATEDESGPHLGVGCRSCHSTVRKRKQTRGGLGPELLPVSIHVRTWFSSLLTAFPYRPDGESRPRHADHDGRHANGDADGGLDG